MSKKFTPKNFLNSKTEFSMETKTNATPLNHDPIRTKILLDYAPLIKFIATQIISRLPAHVDLKDLFSAGMIGLMDAIDKYDPSRDNKFKTYAEFRIRGAVMDELRNQDWLPRSAREINKKERQAQSELEQKLGRPPTAQEMANFLQITLADYQMQTHRTNINLVSLDELAETNLHTSKSFISTLDNDLDQNPYLKLNSIKLQSVVSQTINELPIKQKLVIEMYYYKELSLKEIGKLLKITESRVSQLHTAGIARMKKKLKDVLTE